MAVVTELVTKFTFKGSIKPLQEFNANLGKSIKLITATAAAIGFSALGIGAFAINTLKAAEGTKKLATETGVSIEKIQELGYAASVSGSDAQTLESSLVSLSNKIGQAAQTGSEDFSRLGISASDMFGNVKKADQVLFEIADRFKQMNLSLPQKQNIASSLGIDSSLLELLSKSSAEIDKLRAKARLLGVITKQQALGIQNFNNSITTLRFGLSSLQTQIAIGLSPAIKEIAERFTDWLVENKDLIKNGIESLAKWIGIIFNTIKRLIIFIDDVVTATVGWKVALIGIGIVLAATLSPVYLISAAIAAVLLVIDDLIVAFKGGKSVIRDFFQEFFGFDITPVLRGLVEGFKNAVAIIKRVFTDLFGWIMESIEVIMKGFKFVAGLFGGNDDNNPTKPLQNNSSAPQGIVSPSSIVPDYTKIQNKTSNNQITQNVKIDIKSSDPEAAGKSVNDNLQNQLQSSQVQLNRGGR